MNIVVIGKKNHLEWDSSTANALKELGYNVKHFQINNQSFKNNIVGLYNKNKAHELHAKSIRDSIIDFKPNIIFFISAFFIPITYYKYLRDLPFICKIAAWDADEAIRYEYNKQYGYYIDILFSATYYYLNNHFNEFKNVHLLQCAVDTNKFKNNNFNKINKAYFAAAYNNERCKFINSISENQIILKGWGWNKCSILNKSHNTIIINKKIKLSQVAKDYDQYQITLNLHQKDNALHGGLNMRTFEAPACGSMIISDKREDLNLSYEDGKEIITYKNFDEAKELINRYTKDTLLAKIIAQNAYKRTLEFHTYKVRMNQFLNVINQY
jgi:spore maturation protein CgeB